MQYEKFLRWAAIGGLFLIPVVPFVISTGMFFPFITGKNFLFRILVELLFGVWVLLALKDPKYRPHFSWILAVLAAFVAWMAVATILSVDPVKSFWSNFERMEGYLTLLHLFAYFIVAYAILHAERLWSRLFEISIIASAVMGVYAMSQYVGIIPIDQGSTRIDATLGNATYFAVYLLFNIFLALFLLWREPRLFSNRSARVKVLLTMLASAALFSALMWITHSIGAGNLPTAFRFISGSMFLTGALGLALVFLRDRSYFAGFLIFTLLLDVIGLFLTESRGPILGMLGGFAVGALALWWMTRGTGEWHRTRTVGLWAVGALAALALVFAAVRAQPWVQHIPGLNRIASISLSDATTQSRFLIWEMAWKGFVESPKTAALGWGQENFNFIFNKYYQPNMWNQEQWFDRTHNSFLDWLIAGGAPAFFLYIALFVLAASAVARARTLSAPDRAILLGLLAAYAFHSLFVFDNIVSSIYFFTILALAHALSERDVPAYLLLSRPVGERGMAVVAPIVAVVVLGGAWMLNAPGLANAADLIGAISTTDRSTGAAVNPASNLAYFKRVLSGAPLGRQEATEQLMQFAASVGASSSASPEIKQQFYTTAHDAMTKMIAERPNDARLELFFGAFLNQFNQGAEALEYLAKASANSPDKQAILFEAGINSYLRAQDYPNAVAVLKKAFELAPEYDTARIYYAAALYKSGQSAVADQLLIDRWGTTAPTDNDALLQTYYATGLYDRAAAMLRARIAANPADAQAYLTLAAVYYGQGNKEEAIAVLQEGAKHNEDFAAQAQALITQIRQEK